MISFLRKHSTTPRAVRFITSFNEVLFEASGRRNLTSFRAFNPHFEIIAYIEASTPEALETLKSELGKMQVPWIVLNDVPLLGEFLSRARDVIPQELGGDAPAEMYLNTENRDGVWWRKQMFRWFRKIVALDHTLQNFDEILIWTDCDCIWSRTMTQRNLQQLFKDAGIFYMQGDRQWSETGVVGYDLKQPGVRALLTAMRDHYLEGHFRHFARWDDCFTFDHIRAHQSIAVCRDLGGKADAQGNILPATPLARYLEHEKGLHNRKMGLIK